MKLFIRYGLCLFFLLIFVHAYGLTTAGPGKVTGRVTDSKTKEPLEFVNISLKNKVTGNLAAGITTGANGRFTLNNIAEGTYVFSVTYIGYQTVEKTITISSSNSNIDLKTISMEEDSQVLSEVEVVGQKAQMRFDIDKRVFDVSQNIASIGGSASDVLSNIPSIDVDNEGTVSLRGNESVTIWINGKASGLTSDNQSEILEQLPAESIESIEVITNPSAKYSPEGTAGIINIILKEDRQAGYYGGVQVGANTMGGYNASGNINYSSGKLEAFANLGFRHRVRESGGYTNRLNISEQDTTYLNQTTNRDEDGNNIFTRLGLTWHATRKDHISLNGFGMFGGRDGTTQIDYLSNSPDTYISSERISSASNDMNGGNIEFGYKHDFSKKSNIDLTVSWNKWNMDDHTIYEQESLYEDDVVTYSYQDQINNIHNKNWEVQLDYVNSFKDKLKLEAGYKGTFARENSPVETLSGTSVDDAVEDEDLYNRFIYNQDIHAIYTTLSGDINKFGIMLGLRGEYSNIHSKSLGYGQTEDDVSPYKNDYFSLFPSVFLSYSLPRENEFQLNYTRRISRPRGGQLNSFLNITDSTSISFGNPELLPQYSNAFEMNYIKTWENHMLSVSGYYRNTNNVIQRIRFMDGDIMKTTYENVSKRQAAGVELVGKNKLFRALDLTTTVNLYYSKLDGFTYLPEGASSEVTGDAEENFSWNAKMIANIILPLDISLQFTGSYSSKRMIAQGYNKPNYFLDAGLRKSFFKKKLSLSISARDLLDSRKRHNITYGSGFWQDQENWFGGRRFNFTLSFNFGNMSLKKDKGNDRESESEEDVDI